MTVNMLRPDQQEGQHVGLWERPRKANVQRGEEKWMPGIERWLGKASLEFSSTMNFGDADSDFFEKLFGFQSEWHFMNEWMKIAR